MIVLEDVRDFEGYRAWLEGSGWIAGLSCDRCRSSRLHGHGGYRRKGLLLENGSAAPLLIRRVMCRDCSRAPSVVPAFAAGLRVVGAAIEAVATRYLARSDSTYRCAAAWLGIAHSTVHQWVTRLGGIALVGLVGLLLRLRPDLDPLALLPKLVPEEHRKARTPARIELIRTALRVLVAGRWCADERDRGVARRPMTVFDLVRQEFPT